MFLSMYFNLGTVSFLFVSLLLLVIYNVTDQLPTLDDDDSLSILSDWFIKSIQAHWRIEGGGDGRVNEWKNENGHKLFIEPTTNQTATDINFCDLVKCYVWELLPIQ